MEAVPPGKSRHRSPTPQTRSQLRDGAIAGAFTLDRASTPYSFLLAHHIIRKRSHPAFDAFRDHAPASRDYFFPEPWPGLCWPRDELNPDEAGTTTFLLAFGFFFSCVLRF